ncbi:hypothetical protein HPB47_023441 [Ixodes persulcatus]|uniref:Uncharacterized protein n=1 Tax=Ixodes persulcatus TaxID=34615 RepID=A0AC60Q6X1_IXOPE|nr:hypothetical protein HPB47_023441 [Ixodes persulcatus]
MSALLARPHRRGGPDCVGDTRDLEVKRGPGEGRETKGVEREKLVDSVRRFSHRYSVLETGASPWRRQWAVVSPTSSSMASRAATLMFWCTRPRSRVPTGPTHRGSEEDSLRHP